MTADRKKIAAGALLVLAVLTSYSPAFHAGYIWDDDAHITENATLRDWHGLYRIWFDPQALPQYYPLVHTTFWIESRIWGAAPRGFHVVNIVLHALGAILLWSILRRLAVPGGWWAAAIFALHPVHVESVAWITERKNILSSVFYFLSLLTYLRFSGLDRPKDPDRRSWAPYTLSLFFFTAALLSKTVTASLPATILLLTWWKRERIRRRNLYPLIPMFLIGTGMGLMTAWLEMTHVGASGETWDLSWIERILVAGRALLFYAGKLVWPAELSFNYVRWNIDPNAWWQFIYPVAVAAAILALWLGRKRLGRAPLIALLFFAGTLVPALGFFNVYPFRYAYVADHFQYLASIGPIVLVVGLAAKASTGVDRLFRAWGLLFAAIVLAALGVLTWQQTHVYRDVESLWRDTLRTNPTSWLANNNLGNLRMRTGRLQDAASHFAVAIRSGPTYVETYNNMAIAMMNLGRYQEAFDHARRAIELRPQNKFAYNTLGNAYLRAGQPDESIRWFAEALKRDPGFLKARNNLAVALTQTGRLDEAIDQFTWILEHDPDNLSARTNLAIALVQTGRREEAIHHFEEALRLDPENPVILENLSRARSVVDEADPPPDVGAGSAGRN